MDNRMVLYVLANVYTVKHWIRKQFNTLVTVQTQSHTTYLLKNYVLVLHHHSCYHYF